MQHDLLSNALHVAHKQGVTSTDKDLPFFSIQSRPLPPTSSLDDTLNTSEPVAHCLDNGCGLASAYKRPRKPLWRDMVLSTMEDERTVNPASVLPVFVHTYLLHAKTR